MKCKNNPPSTKRRAARQKARFFIGITSDYKLKWFKSPLYFTPKWFSSPTKKYGVLNYQVLMDGDTTTLPAGAYNSRLDPTCFSMLPEA